MAIEDARATGRRASGSACRTRWRSRSPSTTQRTPSPSAPSWSASGASWPAACSTTPIATTSRGSSWTTRSARRTPPPPARTSAPTTRPPPARGRPMSGWRRTTTRSPRRQAHPCASPAHARQRRRLLRALAAVGRAPARLHDQRRPRRPDRRLGSGGGPRGRARRIHRHRLPDRAGQLRAVVAPVAAGCAHGGMRWTTGRSACPCPESRASTRCGKRCRASPSPTRTTARRSRARSATASAPGGWRRATAGRTSRGPSARPRRRARPPGRGRCRARCRPRGYLRLHYEHGHRDFEAYDSRLSPGASRVNVHPVRSLGAGRRYDQAARDLDRVGARIEVAPASGAGRRRLLRAGPAGIPADRVRARANSRPTWPPRTRRWPPADAGARTAFYALELESSFQRVRHSPQPTISIDLRNVWDATLSDTVHSLGAGFAADLDSGRTTLSPRRGVPARRRARRFRAAPPGGTPDLAEDIDAFDDVRWLTLSAEVEHRVSDGLVARRSGLLGPPGGVRPRRRRASRLRAGRLRARHAELRLQRRRRAGPGHAPMVRNGATVDTVGTRVVAWS